MEDRDILLQEYNTLWNEKIIHKQSIRKFHNYLTYLTAICSLALTFHGVSAQEFFKNPDVMNQALQNAASIVHLFFIPFTPIVIITLIFPLNDLFHIYVMGNQIGQIEKKINSLSRDNQLLVWEHAICPVVYGGEKIKTDASEFRITNLISAGDKLLLVPVLFLVCVSATILSAIYLFDKLGCLATVVYVLLIVYMISSIVSLVLKLLSYTKPEGFLAKAIQLKNPVIVRAEDNKER